MITYNPNTLVGFCVVGLLCTTVLWLILLRWVLDGITPPFLLIGKALILICGVVVTSSSQQQPIWAQEQRDNDRRFQDIESRIAKLREEFAEHKGAQARDDIYAANDRYETKRELAVIKKEVEANGRFRDFLQWLGPGIIAAIVVTVRLIEVFWVRRRNGRNGHANGGHGK